MPFDWTVAISSALKQKPSQEKRLAALAWLITSPDENRGWPLLAPLFIDELTDDERDLVMHWYEVWDAERSGKQP